MDPRRGRQPVTSRFLEVDRGHTSRLCQRTGHGEAANLLQQSFDEEKNADQALTDLAESRINAAAASGEETSAEAEEETEEAEEEEEEVTVGKKR